MTRTRATLRLAVTLPVVLLVALAGVALPTAARADQPLRIMLSGDSITQGFDGDYTWRYRLWQEFGRQGVPVDFVGSQRLPHVVPGYSTAQYLDPNFDSDHFAFGGSLLSGLATRIQAEVAVQQPDVLVIAAGVNDLRARFSPAQVADSLRAFVAAARAAKPDVRLVVSPVLGAVEARMPWLPSAITDYDALLPGVVAELSTTASPVTLADTTVGWSPSADSYFGLHPNPTGETLIAQHVAETLQQIGVLPQAPQVYRALPWLRNLQAAARVHGRTVRLRWDAQSLTGVRIRVRRVGGGARTVAVSARSGHRVLTGLRRGRYEVRLVAVRHQMRSPRGPATYFRVR